MLLHLSNFIQQLNLTHIMKSHPFKQSGSISGILHEAPFASAYTDAPVRPVIVCTTDLTIQSFKTECDINHIMAQYQATGIIDHLNRLPPQWGDAPDYDFHTAENLLLEARDKFNALPSQVRERFGNQPANMMAFLQDEANRTEGEQLGLLAPRLPIQVEAPTPPPSPAKPASAV
ncbi:MAG: internal scaffolding protein [Microvirus sp.]|nr:MAG: internal scaffolding protein [Microvirus sp.]